jgi:hypothetical protein
LENLEEQTKIQWANNIKTVAAERRQGGADWIQLFEDSALTEFYEFGNEPPGATELSSYLIIWLHEGPDTKKQFIFVKEHLGQLISIIVQRNRKCS